MTSTDTSREIFDSLFDSSSLWLSDTCQTDLKEVKTWSIINGEITALCFSTRDIPKAGLSILKREDKNEATYRVGLNIYPQNPRVPDGSFAVLLSRQEEFGFIGGVIELFPTVKIDDDIDEFKDKMKAVAQKHGQNYESCSKGLVGAFKLKDSEENLGAEAGFNFYRSDMDATFQNILFAKEAYLKALEVYKNIMRKRMHKYEADATLEKEPFWQKHLKYMKNEDIGIKLALEQQIPMDFFKFSAFPPVKY